MALLLGESPSHFVTSVDVPSKINAFHSQTSMDVTNSACWRYYDAHFLSTFRYANIFLHPVTDDIAPGYTSIVFRYHINPLMTLCVYSTSRPWAQIVTLIQALPLSPLMCPSHIVFSLFSTFSCLRLDVS